MTREEAIETVLAMAKVQDGYAKRATDPGLKIIHKANAKAQREVAAVIAADLAALDRVRSDYANIVKDLIAKQTEIVAAETALAALTAREGELVGALRGLGPAHHNLCGARPQKIYDAMIAAGMSDRLTELDAARHEARAALQHKDDTHGPE